MSASYYQILGIEPTATQDEIKTAYRKLALKAHPDQGGDTNEFQKLSEAYQTLSDPQQRAQYDHRSSAPRFDSSDLEDMLKSFHGFNFREHFRNIFTQEMHRKNRNVELQTTITLEQAYSGFEFTTSIKLPSGNVKDIVVKIPPGTTNGTSYIIRGAGDDGNSEVPTGDAILKIRVETHSEYERIGDTLIKSLELDALDAILGKEVIFTSINGKNIKIKIPEGTQNGTRYQIDGHGMPNMHQPEIIGPLILHIAIKIPTDLTDDQKDFIRQAKI